MKIGLITYHWVPNFGANLQALATTRWLRAAGHEVFVLDYRPAQLVEKYGATISSAQLDSHEEFCRDHLPMTAMCGSLADVREVAYGLELDLAITGSDAVFRLDRRLNREDTTYPNPFWLGWAGELGIPQVALAASAMGTNFLMLPRATRWGAAERLKAMMLVTVRDNWTEWMVRTVTRFSVRPEFLADPVFLLGGETRPPKAATDPRLPDRYVVFGAPGRVVEASWVEEFVRLAHAYELAVVGLPTPEGHCVGGPFDVRIDLPLSPLKWHGILANAAGYVGVRFHPVVVCLADQVPFVALDLYQRPRHPPIVSKTYDLTHRLGLSGRCVNAHRVRRIAPAQVLDRLINAEDSYKSIARAFTITALARYRRLLQGLCEMSGKD